MKPSWHWLLALALALPAWAQDEPAAEEAEVVPVEEPGAAEEAAAEAPAAEEVAEEVAGEGAEDADSDAPLVLYGGVDLVTSYLAPSGVDAELQSGLYRIHVGAQPYDNLKVEVQGGVHEGSYGPGEFRSESYVGAFIVPFIDAFWVLELSFPVGYANTAAKLGPTTKRNLHSVAYGFEAALPLRAFGEALPDLKFTGGGMVYYQKSDAQIYGVHVGLSYGFGG